MSERTPRRAPLQLAYTQVPTGLPAMLDAAGASEALGTFVRLVCLLAASMKDTITVASALRVAHLRTGRHLTLLEHAGVIEVRDGELSLVDPRQFFPEFEAVEERRRKDRARKSPRNPPGLQPESTPIPRLSDQAEKAETYVARANGTTTGDVPQDGAGSEHEPDTATCPTCGDVAQLVLRNGKRLGPGADCEACHTKKKRAEAEEAESRRHPTFGVTCAFCRRDDGGCYRTEGRWRCTTCQERAAKGWRLRPCSVCDAERLCADDTEGHPICDRCTSPVARAQLAEVGIIGRTVGRT